MDDFLKIIEFSEADLSAIWLSLKVAFWCSFISLPISVLIGYVLARYQFPGKTIFEWVVHLPMVLPPVVTGYLLLLLLGTNGLIGEYLYEYFGIQIAFRFAAAVIAAIVVSIPLAVRAVRIAFEMVDPGLEEASLTLGVSNIKTFFKVSLPLSLPGILGGFVLSLARSMGEFGATITFAGNIHGVTQTLPLGIYSSIQSPGEEMATIRLVVVSILISLISIIVSEAFSRKYKHTS
jgi:molybdate transport system permease protein